MSVLSSPYIFNAVLEAVYKIFRRIIDSNHKAPFSTSLNESFKYIFLIWGIHYIEPASFGVPKTKARVVFCSKNYVFHSCIFSKDDYLFRIPVHGGKCLR